MPRTVLPDARLSPRFAGIATFCRYPRLEDVAAENRPVDWAIFGVPFDGGVTYRPGARFGPRAIREASQYIKRYSMAHSIDVCDTLSLADAGDAPISPYDMTATLDQVADFATGLADESTRLLAVGGDHSIAYANLRATYARRGEPAGGLPVIHFDAHLDTTDEVWGCKWGHASPFRRAIEEGLVNPAKMISIGIRGPLNTGADLDYAKKNGRHDRALRRPDGRRRATRPRQDRRLRQTPRRRSRVHLLRYRRLRPRLRPGHGHFLPRRA